MAPGSQRKLSIGMSGLLVLRSLTRLLGDSSAPGLAQVAAAVLTSAYLRPIVSQGHAQLRPGRQRPSPVGEDRSQAWRRSPRHGTPFVAANPAYRQAGFR